ncbi:hypothetical protein H8E77_22250 [bacterium]|nr:hypothetical protein [bacterium]
MRTDLLGFDGFDKLRFLISIRLRLLNPAPQATQLKRKSRRPTLLTK